MPFELPVAMPQGIVSDVLWAGIKRCELWLQVHTSNTCRVAKGINYGSAPSEPLSLLTL